VPVFKALIFLLQSHIIMYYTPLKKLSHQWGSYSCEYYKYRLLGCGSI